MLLHGVRRAGSACASVEGPAGSVTGAGRLDRVAVPIPVLRERGGGGRRSWGRSCSGGWLSEGERRLVPDELASQFFFSGSVAPRRPALFQQLEPGGVVIPHYTPPVRLDILH